MRFPAEGGQSIFDHRGESRCCFAGWCVASSTRREARFSLDQLSRRQSLDNWCLVQGDHIEPSKACERTSPWQADHDSHFLLYQLRHPRETYLLGCLARSTLRWISRPQHAWPLKVCDDREKRRIKPPRDLPQQEQSP